MLGVVSVERDAIDEDSDGLDDNLDQATHERPVLLLQLLASAPHVREFERT